MVSRKTSMGRKALAVVVASSLAISGSTVAHADDSTDSPESYEVGNSFPKNPSEAELAEAGLTRADAEKVTQDYIRGIEEAQESGELSEDEANEMLELAESPDSGGDDGVSTRALPLWAAAAVVGCAAGVVVGEGKTQIKNALKEGASVDQATDIAIGSAVDCVFGAVPGGVVTASIQKALTQPIKAAVKPAVKKGVEQIAKE